MPKDKIRVSRAGNVSFWEKKTSSGWNPWPPHESLPTDLMGKVTIQWKKSGNVYKKKVTLDLDDEYRVTLRTT